MVFSSTTFISDSTKLASWKSSFATAVDKAISVGTVTASNPGVSITSFASTNNANSKSQYLLSMDVFGACDDTVISTTSATAISASSYSSAKGLWNKVSALAKNKTSVFYTFSYVTASGTSVASLESNGTDWDTYPGEDFDSLVTSSSGSYTPSVFAVFSLALFRLFFN